MTVRTPWVCSSVRVRCRDTVVLVQDPLEHLDPARARVDVPAVVADVAVMNVVAVVVVLVLGAVGVAVEATHQRASPRNAGSSAVSNETSISSSPERKATSRDPHVAHANTGTSSVVTDAHALQATVAGTCSISSRAPSSEVVAVSISHENVHRVRHHLAQVTDADRDGQHLPPDRSFEHLLGDRFAQRQLVHAHPLGPVTVPGPVDDPAANMRGWDGDE